MGTCEEELIKTFLWSHLEFLLSQSSLLSLQGLDPLQNVGVLDVGFHPSSQGSSCCACTFCILKNKAKLAETVWEIIDRYPRRPASSAPLCQGHLWIEWGRVPVEQLLHALADLGCDAPGLKGSNVLPNTTLGQKATGGVGINKGK